MLRSVRSAESDTVSVECSRRAVRGCTQSLQRSKHNAQWSMNARPKRARRRRTYVRARSPEEVHRFRYSWRRVTCRERDRRAERHPAEEPGRAAAGSRQCGTAGERGRPGLLRHSESLESDARRCGWLPESREVRSEKASPGPRAMRSSSAAAVAQQAGRKRQRRRADFGLSLIHI